MARVLATDTGAEGVLWFDMLGALKGDIGLGFSPDTVTVS